MSRTELQQLKLDLLNNVEIKIKAEMEKFQNVFFENNLVVDVKFFSKIRINNTFFVYIL